MQGREATEKPDREANPRRWARTSGSNQAWPISGGDGGLIGTGRKQTRQTEFAGAGAAEIIKVMTATTPAKLELTGASGRRYTSYVFEWGATFKPGGGVYAVTRATPKPDGGSAHQLLYIGQTGDLSERFDVHQKAEVFRRNGANRVCAFAQENAEARLAAERDLVAVYHPPRNG